MTETKTTAEEQWCPPSCSRRRSLPAGADGRSTLRTSRTTLAQSLASMDDEVDVLYETVQADLIALMKQDPDNIERATYLLLAAHNIERVADRSTNIAERAVYLATGQTVNIGSID